MALVAIATSACISNPARGITATGEPARVIIVSGTGTRLVDQQVGGSVTTHADGSESSTVSYRTVAQRFKWRSWRFYQGRDRVDEQDWFSLKDPAATDQIKAARASAYRMQLVGLPLAI